MHRVEVMPLQSAVRAGEAHLVWLQERGDEAQEQCYPEDHDDDRDEAARGSLCLLRAAPTAVHSGIPRQEGSVLQVASSSGGEATSYVRRLEARPQH